MMKRFTQKTDFISDSDGLSLVSTLWILTILSVVAMQLLYSFNLENKAQNNFSERVKYHYAAKAGFELGLAKLRNDETSFDSLGETWAAPIEEAIDDGIQVGRFLTFRAAITDESARVNLNTAPVATIRNLLLLSGAQAETDLSTDLAARIIEGRPFRTVRDVARIEGMTEQILYGIQVQTAPTSGSEEQGTQTELAQLPQLAQIQPSSGGIVTLTTVHSLDANTDTNGQARVNINSANAQQLSGIRSNNNQNVFSQGEAQAIIQAREFSGLAALLDVPAVSNQVFNNISGRITIQEIDTGNEDDNGFGPENQGGGNNNQVNINNADEDELEELPGIDQGIAQRIVAHRDAQGDFQSIDAIRDVRVLTMQEFAGIVDRITTKDGQTVDGLVNINTAPVEILQLLPGMDQAKAQAIKTRREEENTSDNGTQNNNSEDNVTGNPFSNISQLLQLDEIDNQTFRQVVDYVTYRTRGYRIESMGVDATGKTLARCVGIVIREENQLDVPYWRQD
ncbi:hypothetical protein F4083_03095 [Candidatus Poribacteria bacterium]|nr:hypothetical protein [Candidatus Poribacteria bacterium]MYB66773.1 hypothetical protein [Candidatus Poribacteria bacterium]MYF56896.1 hypothetical protein [Candidatus Poribacteria bacterium]MYI93299.1 hypothetical protein [Candidatus Poribacteria bacterium]